MRHLKNSQYTCYVVFFFEMIRKIGLTHDRFLVCILGHTKILVPLGLDVKEILIQQSNIHSVGDRTWKSLSKLMIPIKVMHKQ